MATGTRAIQQSIRALGDPAIAEHSQRFFKTGPGEYGEGDVFLGIRVPVIRKEVRRHRDADRAVILRILQSRYHEERLFALLSMVDRFQRGDEATREAVYTAYLANTRYINNWDLVDTSASQIVGAWLENRDRDPLYLLARSEDLWERRIAIISTLHFIRLGQFRDTLEISRVLRDDEHDLIHKAVGWMLREVGKRDRDAEVKFLERHYRRMPRTMLRYAIEHFPAEERRAWLDGPV